MVADPNCDPSEVTAVVEAAGGVTEAVDYIDIPGQVKLT